MKETARDEIAAMLEKAAPDSIARMVQRAADPEVDNKLRQAADEYIVDRYLGKAVQPIRNDADDLKNLTEQELKAVAAGEEPAARPKAE